MKPFAGLLELGMELIRPVRSQERLASDLGCSKNGGYRGDRDSQIFHNPRVRVHTVVPVNGAPADLANLVALAGKSLPV